MCFLYVCTVYHVFMFAVELHLSLKESIFPMQFVKLWMIFLFYYFHIVICIIIVVVYQVVLMYKYISYWNGCFRFCKNTKYSKNNYKYSLQFLAGYTRGADAFGFLTASVSNNCFRLITQSCQKFVLIINEKPISKTIKLHVQLFFRSLLYSISSNNSNRITMISY